MIKITAINYMGERLELSPDKYAIKKVKGLSPQEGTISTQKMARHGTEYNSATTDERNIVIDFKVLGDVEANREALYDAFPPSLPVTLEIETERKRVTIEGYTETCDVDQFKKITTGQISILCPDPFFRATEATYEAGEAGVAILSSCPFEGGYKVTVTFTEASNVFTLTNVTTGVSLTVKSVFKVGSVVEIDIDERTIFAENGEWNLYNGKSGDWPMLRRGTNIITASHPATITYADKFIGV